MWSIGHFYCVSNNFYFNSIFFQVSWRIVFSFTLKTVELFLELAGWNSIELYWNIVDQRKCRKRWEDAVLEVYGRFGEKCQFIRFAESNDGLRFQSSDIDSPIANNLCDFDGLKRTIFDLWRQREQNKKGASEFNLAYCFFKYWFKRSVKSAINLYDAR